MSTIANQFKTALLLGLLTGLLLVIGFLIGGQSGLIIGLIFSVLMNFLSYFFSDKIVLMMYKAKEAKESNYPQFHKIVNELIKEAGLPKPKLYIIPIQTPNAFATGRNPNHAAVAVTEGILDLLNKEELKGVIAHELAHIKDRDILISTIAATIAGVISYIAMMARFTTLSGRDNEERGGNIISLILLGILAPIIAMIIQLAISRSREYLADSIGAKISKHPTSLASALEKLDNSVKTKPLKSGNPATAHMFIVNPFSGKSLLGLFSTHPPIQERVKRLKAMKI